MRFLDKQVTLEFQRIPEIDLTSSREFDMKFDFSRLLKSFLFLTLSSVVLGLFMRDLQKTPGEWPVLLLSLVLSVGILWVVLGVLWTLTQGLKQILLGTVQVIDSPRVTALLGIGVLLTVLGLGLRQLEIGFLGLSFAVAGFVFHWPRLLLRFGIKTQVSVWRWTRRLRPTPKLELVPYAYAPKPGSASAPQTLAPRLELSLEDGQVWLENQDSASVLVKGLGSAEFNGWWLPRSRGERKPLLNTLEKVEADLWVQDYESVRVKVWCCRLENPLEEFVLERELGFEVVRDARVLN